MNPGLFKDIVDYAVHLEEVNGSKNTLLREMKDAYHMKWGEQANIEKQLKHLYITLSPDFRNSILMARRLLTTVDVRFNVSQAVRVASAVNSSLLEKYADTMLKVSDRIQGTPLHVDAVTSCLLYDEVHIGVSRTKDWVDQAQGGSKAVVARAKRAASLTPFLFTVFDPLTCYADIDYLGMRAWCRKVTWTENVIRDRFGDAGMAAIGRVEKSKSHAGFSEYTGWEFYDLSNYQAWLDGDSEPIMQYDHGFPVIPIVSHIVEGSRTLFSDAEEQREPFGFSIIKSKMWNRQNLLLTVIFSDIAAGGIFPQVEYIANPTDDAPVLDMESPFAILRHPPGTELKTWSKQLIDPQVYQGLAIAEQKGVESTLYRQVGGQPLGPGSTYSEVALLSQSGRQPLAPTKRKADWSIGDAMRVAYNLMKDEGGEFKLGEGGKYNTIRATDIPEILELEANLEISLPQDRLSMANTFNILNGKVPIAWLLENVLNVNQPEEMMKELWKEQAAQANFSILITQMIQQAQQAQQQAAQMQNMMAQQQAQTAPAMPGGQAGPIQTTGGMFTNPPGPVQRIGEPVAPGGGGYPEMEGLPTEMGMNGAQGPVTPMGEEGGGEYANY